MLSRINEAVKAVGLQIMDSTQLGDWRSLDESKLRFEMTSCILGSLVSAEIANRAATRIAKAGLLNQDCSINANTEQKISNLLRNIGGKSGYRFYKSKAKYITHTLQNLKRISLTELLDKPTTPTEARLIIANTIVGFGPKQTSLFLRNIGYTYELGILDAHVLKFMKMNGLYSGDIPSGFTSRQYSLIEENLIDFAHNFGMPVGMLDQAIWIVMRVIRSMN